MNRPLDNPLFRRLWSANFASNIGFWMQATGAAWMMTTLSGSPLMVTFVHLAATLPVFLFALPGGSLADRMDKARLLGWIQLARAGCALTLVALCLLDRLSPGGLLLITFLLGGLNAVGMPAWQAAIAQLVPPQSLSSATSLNNLSFNLGRALGSSLAGVLMSLAGPAGVFGMNALSTVGLIRVYQTWRPGKVATPTTGYWKSLSSGSAEILKHAEFRRLVTSSGFLFFCATATWALLPAFAEKQLGLGAAGFGLLLGSIGVGALLAAVWLGALKLQFSRGELTAFAAILFGVSEILLAWVRSPVLTAVILIGNGLAWSIIVSLQNAAVQHLFAAALQARAAALNLLFFYASMSLGGVVWGMLAESIGVAGVLAISGMVLIVGTTGWALANRVRESLAGAYGPRREAFVAVPFLEQKATASIGCRVL